MNRHLEMLSLLLSLLLGSVVPGAAPPGKPRELTKEEAKQFEALETRHDAHASAGEFEQAASLSQQMATFRRERQGGRHRDTIDASFFALEWKGLATVAPKDRAEVLRARKLNVDGVELHQKGRFREAEKLIREAMTIREKLLGERHSHFAESLNNLGSCLSSQRKNAEALPLYRRALLIREKVLGRNHPDTGNSYFNVAMCLREMGKIDESLRGFREAATICGNSLGPKHPHTILCLDRLAGVLLDQDKHLEALPVYRRVLDLRLEILGRDHPDTASTYNFIGACLNALARHAEALLMYREALSIRAKVLGPTDSITAVSFNNVGMALNDQGKHAEALPLLRAALAIWEKAPRTESETIATSANNVGYCLVGLEKYDEAFRMFNRSLQIREKVLGRDHPDTASSYNNLAGTLACQRKIDEAMPLFRKALQIREKTLGPYHRDTATSYNNVASFLGGEGQLEEALTLFRKARLACERSLGPNHPNTAQTLNGVAYCYWQQGRQREAVHQWQQMWVNHEGQRVVRADSGFDRSHTRFQDIEPRVSLAIGLATLKQPRNAFAHAEGSLARGLLDDLSPLTPAEIRRVQDLRRQVAQLEPALASYSARLELTDEQKERQQLLKRQAARLWAELSELLVLASTRPVYPLERIQQAIPSDGALLFWMLGSNQLWACVVRNTGKPIWHLLKDAKLKDPWTIADKRDSARLYDALIDPGSDDRDRQKLLTTFRERRFDPIRPHLNGVKRLFVVPIGALAHIPAEVFADDFTVSYIPSGSMLARVIENHRKFDGSSLLALGDPTFDSKPPAEPPASGLLVQSVLPSGNGAKAGLQPGDVLLSIGSTKLESFDDLEGGLSSLPANAEVWRDGKTSTVRMQGTPLGVVFDKRSARAAVRAWRREQGAQRSTGHKRLPGTRLEVEAISAMLTGSTPLLGSDASEQKLDELIDSARLKRYRIVHMATHGEADELVPTRSAVILAQDRLPNPLAQLKSGQHPYDGRLTVARIRERWQLDADLVVLSACETGLGKEARGDGLLGFAQAFLGKGARSVILSRWKVDDTATSLLMIRLYENLLGKRELKKPMGRATALAEAKKWLRTLPRKEAERLATLHHGGVLRGSEGSEKTPDKVKRVAYTGDTPFAHPYYWAAFTLIGDPD